MEPPSKRIRLDDDEDTDELEFAPEVVNERRDPGYQLQKSRAFAALKLKSTWESIFDKYGKDLSAEDDEIDLRTGEVVVNNGHLQSLENAEFGGDAVNGRTPSDSESLDEEERIMHGRPVRSRDGKELGRLVPKLGSGRPTITGNWPGLSSFLPGRPRLSSMMPQMGAPFGFGANPMSFGSFGPAFSQSSDPTWKVPELPASAFINNDLASQTHAATRRFGIRKMLPAFQDNDGEDDEDDILLGPSVSKIKGSLGHESTGNKLGDNVLPDPVVSAVEYLNPPDLEKEPETARISNLPTPEMTGCSQSPNPAASEAIAQVQRNSHASTDEHHERSMRPTRKPMSERKTRKASESTKPPEPDTEPIHMSQPELDAPGLKSSPKIAVPRTGDCSSALTSSKTDHHRNKHGRIPKVGRPKSSPLKNSSSQGLEAASIHVPPEPTQVVEGSSLVATVSRADGTPKIREEAEILPAPVTARRAKRKKTSREETTKGRSPIATSHGVTVNSIPSPPLTMSQLQEQPCREPAEYLCIGSDNNGQFVAKPSNQRLEVRIVQISSQKAAQEVAGVVPSTPPMNPPESSLQEPSPELGEDVRFKETGASPTPDKTSEAQKRVSNPIIGHEDDIVAESSARDAVAAESFVKNVQDPAYDFSDEDKPMQPREAGQHRKVIDKPEVAIMNTPKQKMRGAKKSQLEPKEILDCDKLEVAVMNTPKQKTRGAKKSQPEPKEVLDCQSDLASRRVTRSSFGSVKTNATAENGPAGANSTSTPQSHEALHAGGPAILPVIGETGTWEHSVRNTKKRKTTPISNSKLSFQNPEKNPSPSIQKTTSSKTTLSFHKAGNLPATPSHKSRPQGSTSKRSIISLISDDEEDELSLGPDAFTPSGSRRKSFHFLRGSSDARGVSPAGLVRKSNLKRGLLLMGGSSPTKHHGTPSGRNLNRISLPVRSKMSSVQKKKARELPSKSRTEVGDPVSPSRAASPVGSELVQTPGGTMRRCGEHGFRCDRDFCFICL